VLVGVYSPLLLAQPHLWHTVTHHPCWRSACTLGTMKQAPVARFKCLGCKLAIVDLISHLPRGQHAWRWPAHTHARDVSTHMRSFWHRRCVLAASAHITGPAHTPEWPAHTHMHETSLGVYSPLLLLDFTSGPWRHYHMCWRPACTLGVMKQAPIARLERLGCRLATVEPISCLLKDRHAWRQPAHAHARDTSMRGLVSSVQGVYWLPSHASFTSNIFRLPIRSGQLTPTCTK
jgi:hypothetical protein